MSVFIGDHRDNWGSGRSRLMDIFRNGQVVDSGNKLEVIEMQRGRKWSRNILSAVSTRDYHIEIGIYLPRFRYECCFGNYLAPSRARHQNGRSQVTLFEWRLKRASIRLKSSEHGRLFLVGRQIRKKTFGDMIYTGLCIRKFHFSLFSTFAANR